MGAAVKIVITVHNGEVFAYTDAGEEVDLQVRFIEYKGQDYKGPVTSFEAWLDTEKTETQTYEGIIWVQEDNISRDPDFVDIIFSLPETIE